MGAAQAPRTAESVRAEGAFKKWTTDPPSERPLRRHRLEIASLLFGVLKAHGVNKTSFAMMLKVDKKQIKKMLDGRLPIPVDVAFALPLDMALDFLAAVREARGVRADLFVELERLDSKALREVRDRVLARLDHLSEKR